MWKIQLKSGRILTTAPFECLLNGRLVVISMKVQVLVKVNEKGSVNITVETVEDFWVLAMVIRPGDKISSQVRRKVKTISKIGKQTTKTIITTATVKVTEVCYQAGVDEMLLRGTLTHDVEDAKKGTFQRVMLAIGREFTLTKKCWDKFSFEQIEEAGNPESGSSVAAVLMQSGLANICIVGKNTTILKRKITKSIPKVKAHGSNGKSVTEKQKFYELVANALITDVNIDDMKCIILASPGFYATEFEKFLSDNAARFKLQNAFSSKKFVVAAVSDAHLPSLESLLAKPEMERHVAHLKSAVQAKIWDTFMRRMTTDVSMVAIGSANVEKCREMGALEHVLVTEKHILSMNLEDRLAFCAKREELEGAHIPVTTFSTKHASGDQLEQLGGIVALLKFAVDTEADEGFDEAEGFD